MKYYIIACILICCSFDIFSQSLILSGKVVEKQTGKPLPGITVTISTEKTETDKSGYFEFILAPGIYVLDISSAGWDSWSREINLENEKTDIGVIELTPKYTEPSSGITEITLDDSDLENDYSNNHIIGPLKSDDDIFVKAASFSFGYARFIPRGYKSDNFLTYINGIPFNYVETGRASYSEWGGLNNVTRNRENGYGLSPIGAAIGSAGGITNIDIRPSEIRNQNSLSYAYSNRSYNQRITYTYSTGLLQNGWSYAISGSKRWAENGYVNGTWYDAYSYYAGIEKQISKNHSASLVAFGAPYQRALQSASVLSAYQLSGNNYYNPNWGMQEGKERNAKIRNVHQPYFIFTDNLIISEKTNLTTSIAYTNGKFGTTALNWYMANNPNPDYYKYLPDYQTDPVISVITANAWMNDISRNQINWDNLYQVNYLSNLSGEPARYIVEERRKDNRHVSFHSYLNHNLNDNFDISCGILVTQSKTHYYKSLNDLLGADYWLDIDQFAERDFPSDQNILQNDLNNPGRKVYEGDIFGYNYDINTFNGNIWFIANYKSKKIDLYAGGQSSFTGFYRYGYMKNGRYPDDSYGKSNTTQSPGFVAKTGLTYKFNLRNYLTAAFLHLSRPAAPEISFVSARVSGRILPELKNETSSGAEFNYIHKGNLLSSRITYFHTYFTDQIEAISFYHDQYQTFVNMSLQGVDKFHQGVEAGLDIRVNRSLNAVIVANLGNYYYTSRPEATISYENGSKNDTNETIYSRYFYSPSGPQYAGMAGLNYRNAKFWFASISVNYFDKNYLTFNPERRTETAISNLGPDDPLISAITAQEKLNSCYTVDFSFGKSWIIFKHFVGINLNINNLLNKQDYITGGYEQMRFDFLNKNTGKFPPKYYYGYGRTYFIMLNFRF